jgi:secreted PhoX family phosphatase
VKLARGADRCDAAGLLDLPRGFRYRVVQSVEDRVSNGAPVPGDFDGMVAIDGPGNSTILVRNHELTSGDTATKAPVAGRNPTIRRRRAVRPPRSSIPQTGCAARM